jgi:hypothetical protein
MRYLVTVLAVANILFIAGCATRYGANSGQWNATVSDAQAYPAPAGSPTQRPGMNSQDPRDAQFTSRSEPYPLLPVP